MNVSRNGNAVQGKTGGRNWMLPGEGLAEGVECCLGKDWRQEIRMLTDGIWQQ